MAKRLSLSFVVFLVSILLLTDSVQKKKNQGSLKVPAAVPKHRTAAAGKGKKPPGASKAQQQAAEIIAAKKKMEAAVSADKIAALQERPAEQLLTMKGMESILLDAQSVLSQLVDNLFYDKKGKQVKFYCNRKGAKLYIRLLLLITVLECLAPYICNLIGLEQYYDPWTQKCKALSNYEIAMRKPKPVRPLALTGVVFRAITKFLFCHSVFR